MKPLNKQRQQVSIVHLQRDEFISNYESFRDKYRTMMASVDVMYDDRLSIQARLLFLIISGLSFKIGYCFATNEGLAERLGLGTTSTKKYLKELEEEKMIENERFTVGNRFRRKIFINFDEMRNRYVLKVKSENPDLLGLMVNTKEATAKPLVISNIKIKFGRLMQILGS
ncbi:MAG: Helix-turn-helix domain [Mucilaginibacter sp.]|uniref:helix-turn-helix domain-containing protein n=1 Tax=Mucilaginibacter sp. TaxID=1882438 RepID=UPI0026151964|nr:helix-turn-helix domain-containing protein [Mucilaginibacter sp.]MDB5002067.1 Helix-turn-helix domain [Mucilaginibacter sp.]